jgi:hypothetical protein
MHTPAETGPDILKDSPLKNHLSLSMDSKFGLRNAREQSRARKKILRTLLTEQSEGNVMDVQGFVKLFDGVIRAGVKAFRGEKLPWVVYLLSKLAPDVNRVLHRVHRECRCESSCRAEALSPERSIRPQA